MTRLTPQLAEPGNLRNAVAWTQDDELVMTQKADGDRRLVLVEDGKVTALNRDGNVTGLPTLMTRQFERINGRWAFDGELLPGCLWLFDMPLAGDRITCESPYHHRRRMLEGVFTRWHPGPYVRILPAAWGQEQKVRMFRRLVRSDAEGVIVNHVDADYQPGQRNPRMLKGKFIHTIDCVVVDVGREGKSNMALGVFDGVHPEPVEIGEVTALAGTGRQAVAQYRNWVAGVDGVNQPVVEVTYLQASPDKRKLVQPNLPRLRDDKRPEECLIDQLVVGSNRIVTL